jgi:molybdopterin-binding protein
MKLSARNVLKGRIVDIDKGKVTAIVRVDIGGGNVVTSSITLAAVKRPGTQEGLRGARHHQGERGVAGRGRLMSG